MPVEAHSPDTLVFGDCRLDTGRGVLLRDGVEVKLRPQSFAVLQYLVGHANRLVSRDELFKAVWGDIVVTDDSLSQCLMEVRRALGDEQRNLIRTVPRRGYVFEATVQSVTAPAPADEAPVMPPPSRVGPAWLAIAGVFVALAAAVTWLLTGPGTSTTPAATRQPSNTIAVLAFADLSERGDQQYFADGVAEEILNLLARVPELRVVARTSSFSFRAGNADVVAIGKALDVAYVLEGSVRRVGNQVRVTAQLVDTTSGAHVWSENHDRELGDLLAVQTSIAERVAQSLEQTLAPEAMAAARGPIDPAAYEKYLQGNFLYTRRMPGDIESAERLFRSSLEIDPEFGAAWASLAAVRMLQVFDRQVAFEDVRAEVGEAIEKALALAPDSVDVQFRAAQFFYNSGDVERADRHRSRASTLGPNNPLVMQGDAARLNERGRPAEALALQRRAVELDPLNAVSRSNYGQMLAAAGNYDEALRQLMLASQLRSQSRSDDQWATALVLFLLGRHEDALAAADGLPEGLPRDQVQALAWHGLGRESEARAARARVERSADPLRALRLAEIHAQWGDADGAFRWIETARGEIEAAAVTPGAKRRAVSDITPSELLGPLHADPRWAALLRRQIGEFEVPPRGGAQSQNP